MAENSIGEMMQNAMDKIHTMFDSDTVVGSPVVTPDGVTLIPVSKMSFGFASGGSDKSGEKDKDKGSVWGGSGAAVKVDPVGFLMIKDGTARMVSIQPPAYTTAERVIDLVPGIIEKIEGYVDKYAKKPKPVTEPETQPEKETEKEKEADSEAK